MEMDAISHARLAWSRLEERDADAGGLPSIELDLYHDSSKVRVALDPSGNRHILIPISLEEIAGNDERSGGVQIRSRILHDGASNRRFVDVVCLKPRLNEIYMRIVDEILARIDDSTNVYAVCSEVLERFRELLRSSPTSGLGIERVVGLLGELLVLRDILKINPSGHASWAGPHGALHDFEAAGVALEVKASTRREGRFFKINGLEQLEPSPGSELYLSTVRLEQAQDAPISLPLLTAEVLGISAERADLLRLLETAGYRVEDADEYADLRFRVVERRVYHVSPSFPALVPSRMKDERIPPGVLEATYTIDLTNEPPSPIDSDEELRIWARLAGVAG